MSIPFDPQHGLVIVRAAVDGPSGSAVLRLALDTGATGTVINVGMLVALGYDPALVPERIQVTTGSSIEFVPRITLHKMTALGQERTNFPVTLRRLDCPTTLAIARVDEATIRMALREICEARVEAIVQVGTDLVMTRLADEAERWLGLPVIAVNAAMLWQALRNSHVNTWGDFRTRLS